MEILLWSVAGLLGIQLLFVLWNVRQMPLFGEPDSAVPLELEAKLAEGKQVPAKNAEGTYLKIKNAIGKHLPAKTAESKHMDMKHAEVTHSEKKHLSVLIPARDEERHIGGCLASIAACLPERAKDIEIIVLDDGSTDATASIAQSFAASDPRFRVVSGEEKPKGWVGKAYACHQLSTLAQGEWLWFMDADARMQPGAFEAIGREMAAKRSGLISGFPLQQTETWLERLVVPMMGFTIACHLPIRLVRRSQDPKFAAAHGGWIGVHRTSYELAGGHEANHSHLVDDVALMRAVKRAGYPVTLADVRPYVTMRMYASASEVWSGYTKNMYAGLGRSGLLLFAVLLLYTLLYLLPPAALLLGWLYPELVLPACTAYVLGAAVKAAADHSQSQPLWLAPLVPLSIAAVIAIGTASWLSAKSGKGYTWKGRSYE